MENKILLLIIILGVAIRLGLVLIVPPDSVETWEYETIADNILQGRGYQMMHLGSVHYSQAPPLYAFLSAGIYALTRHSHLAMQLFQIILSCVLGLVVYKIAGLIFNKTVGLLAAALTVFHPGLIVYSVWKIHPLILDSLFMSLVVLAFLHCRTHLNWRNAFWIGIIAGLAMLTRPTITLFLPFGILWLALAKDIDRKRFVVSCFILLITAAAVILPWIIRNYTVHKKIIFITSDTGELFWRGNNPIASGSAYLPTGETLLGKMPEELFRRIHGKSELVQRDIFTNEALVFVKREPLRAIRLFMKKFYYFWWFSPQAGILYSKNWLNIYKLYYCIVTSFAIFGLFRTFRSFKSPGFYNSILLLLMLLSISLSQSLFYVEQRHRWGVEPIMLIFATAGMFSMVFRNQRLVNNALL